MGCSFGDSNVDGACRLGLREAVLVRLGATRALFRHSVFVTAKKSRVEKSGPLFAHPRLPIVVFSE